MRSLLVISADGLLSPQVTLRAIDAGTTQSCFGWGIAWYQRNEAVAVVHKDPIRRDPSISTTDHLDAASFRSGTIFCKSKQGTQECTHKETQPFVKSFAGSDWTFVHNGYLDKTGLNALLPDESPFLEPLGKTDSELAFCYILQKLHSIGARQLRDVPPTTLRLWLSALDHLGSADLMLSDSTTILAYRGQSNENHLYYGRLCPPSSEATLTADLVSVSFDDPRDTYRTKLIFSSDKLSNIEQRQMQAGQLILAARGSIIWNSDGQAENSCPIPFPTQPKQSEQPPSQPYASTATEQAQTNQVITHLRSVTRSASGEDLSYRVFDISHITEYHYTEPVLRSTHTFRLHPAENHVQQVDYSAITISSAGEQMLYEDVFGNQSLHLSIDEPYTVLRVENQSRVRIYARPADDLSMARRQTSIPLVWMPWQRQMMTPYLLPPELPDTQLEELTSYAMSFVERNDYHLLNTLNDINDTIYRDYRYSQGDTNNDTTAFDVYAQRVGVCQDFANVFICLARLLGVPARYQMGYIHTGAAYENKIQSEASHAWVEVYLPYIGWRGFDPTNGCVVGQDHIAVACGRNYRDATPTSGTLFKGGGSETLKVEVKVQEL